MIEKARANLKIRRFNVRPDPLALDVIENRQQKRVGKLRRLSASWPINKNYVKPRMG